MGRGALLLVLALAACGGDVADAPAPRAGTADAAAKRRTRARADRPDPAVSTAVKRPGRHVAPPVKVEILKMEFVPDDEEASAVSPAPPDTRSFSERIAEIVAMEGMARKRAENELAASIRTSGDPVRRRILDLLATTEDEQTSKALAALFREGIAGADWADHIDALIAVLATGELEAQRVAAVNGLADIRTALPEQDERIAGVFATRLRAESAPDVILAIVSSLKAGSVSAVEREALYACASRLVVPETAVARHPQRFARREVYALLVADAVTRNDWSPPVDAFTRTATQTEKDDIAAGFATFQGAVAVAENERAAVLAMRRHGFTAIYAGTGDVSARRQLVRAAQGPLGVVPGSSAPEYELTPALALARELRASEPDVGVQDAWGLVLSIMTWRPAGDGR